MIYENLQSAKLYMELKNGVPACIKDDSFIDTSVYHVLILDHLMQPQFVHKGHILFRHYLTRNLFLQGKTPRQIALNIKYIAFFNNP